MHRHSEMYVHRQSDFRCSESSQVLAAYNMRHRWTNLWYWPHAAIRHAAAIIVHSMRMFSTTCIHAKLRQFDDEPNFQIGESFGLQNVETFEFQFGESFGLQIVESFGLKNIKSFPARKLARVSSSTLILKVGNLCTGIGMGKCMLIAK